MISTQKRLSTTYVLVQSGQNFAIREETGGVKSWYTPQAWLDYLMNRATFKKWETRHRWIALRRLDSLRRAEAKLVSEENTIWESVREEVASK